MESYLEACQAGKVLGEPGSTALLNSGTRRAARSNSTELKHADQRTMLNPSLLKGHVIFRKLSKQLSSYSTPKWLLIKQQRPN